MGSNSTFFQSKNKVCIFKKFYSIINYKLILVIFYTGNSSPKFMLAQKPEMVKMRRKGVLNFIYGKWQIQISKSVEYLNYE